MQISTVYYSYMGFFLRACAHICVYVYVREGDVCFCVCFLIERNNL